MRPIPARPTATERFHRAALGRGPAPLTWLAGAMGAAFLLAVGWILFAPSSTSAEDLRARVDGLLGEGHELESRFEFDAAVRKFEEALGLIAGNDGWKGRAAEIRGTIRIARTGKSGFDASKAAFEAWRKEGGSGPEGRRLLEQAERARLPWLEELKAALAKAESEAKAAAAAAGELDFEKTRQRIHATHRLGERDGQWSGGIADWREWLKKPVRDEDRPRARAEIAKVEGRAREDLLSLKTRAENRPKAEALELLKKARLRFEKSGSSEALERLIADLAK
jgi:hypothetical protein